MPALARLAVRNLTRRWGRTLLTGGMILLGTALTCISVGLSEGTYDTLIDLATRNSVGHLQVVRAGYPDKPRLNATITDRAAAEQALAETSGVKAFSARVESGGLLALGNRTVAGLMMGVQPDREPAISAIDRTVDEGAWLPTQIGPDDPIPVVLDRQLMRQLKAKVGDEISFVGQGADGSIAAELLTICGVSTTEGGGRPVALMPLKAAQEMLTLGDRVHRLVALVNELPQVGHVSAHLKVHTEDQALTWAELLPGLARSIESDRAGGWIFLGVVLLVVLFGVANTMLMSVFERTRELGVLAALGTRPRHLVALVLWEGLWLSATSAALGGLLGYGVNAWVAQAGIPLGDYAMSFGGVVMDQMRAANHPGAAIGVPVMVVLMALVASVLPARRAARMSPTEALRS